MRPAAVLVAALVLNACGRSSTPSDADAALPASLDASIPDAASPVDAALPVDAASPADAAVPDAASPPDAGLDPNHPGWARCTIPVGGHSATVEQNGAPAAPLAGLSFASSRTYQFILNPSAMYTITNPTQPDDQLDWNKLPGLSDCNQLDLAQDGFMFAWRWRLDLTPRVLELAHYANNQGTHLYPPSGIVTLDADDLAAEVPLTFELSIGGTGNALYLFHISGAVRGRIIDVTAEHPRRCSSTDPGGFKWAAGFYFGGTSTAPSTITGYIREPG